MYFLVNGQKIKYPNQDNSSFRPQRIEQPPIRRDSRNVENNQTPCPLTIYSVLLGIALVGVIIYLLCVVLFKKHKNKH
jgi:hypothetical protein